MTESLQKKVDFAIKLLQSIPTDSGAIEVSYSGGKDSDVILELAKMAGINYRPIYKNTTIDPPGTIAHCKSKGVEIMKPTINFFDLVKKKGCPSRFSRFCCGVLKEYKVCDRAIQGVRTAESVKRAKRYKEPEICRAYPKGQKARVYLPILEWTDDNVAEFISERGVKCHPLYYDENGEFHVERRLGCIGCPMASNKKRIEEYVRYPKILKRTIECEQEFIDTHWNAKIAARYKNAIHRMYANLFCDSYEEYLDRIGGGIFPELAIDPKDFLENYFKIDLTI